MREETKRKLKAKWETVKIKAPLWITGSVIGMGIAGYLGAISNKMRIKRLEKRVRSDEEVINHNADANNNNWGYFDERLNELKENQDLLMKKALKDTLGEGEKG